MVMNTQELQKVPRNTTKENWETVYRWKRKSDRKFADAMQRDFENACIYGNSHPWLFGNIKPVKK